MPRRCRSSSPRFTIRLRVARAACSATPTRRSTSRRLPVKNGSGRPSRWWPQNVRTKTCGRIADLRPSPSAAALIASVLSVNVPPVSRSVARVLTDVGRDVVPGSGEVGMFAAPVGDEIAYRGDEVRSAQVSRHVDGCRSALGLVSLIAVLGVRWITETAEAGAPADLTTAQRT
jgi:hypothetical protein